MSAKTIVITGANRGIGLALAQRFAGQGHRIVGIVRGSSPEIAKVASQLVTVEDIADETLPERVITALDGTPIDTLLNVAGIMHWEQWHELDPAVIRRQFEVNALAPLMLSAGLATAMSKNGKIVILTSRLGSLADNSSGSGYGYRMSKAAVNMAARSLAIDLEPRGVAVSLIHPGSVKTSLNKLGGEIDVEEAVDGIVKRIDELSLTTTGTYRHQNGTHLPW